MMVHTGPRQIFSPYEAVLYPQIPNFGRKFDHLAANISKAVSCSITRQLQLNTSSTGAF